MAGEQARRRHLDANAGGRALKDDCKEGSSEASSCRATSSMSCQADELSAGAVACLTPGAAGSTVAVRVGRQVLRDRLPHAPRRMRRRLRAARRCSEGGSTL